MTVASPRCSEGITTNTRLPTTTDISDDVDFESDSEERARSPFSLKLENPHSRPQLCSLFIKRRSRRRSFFDECRVLLGDFIHLLNSAIHLLDTRALLDGRGCNLAHDAADTLDGLHDLAHPLSGDCDLARTVVHARHR